MGNARLKRLVSATVSALSIVMFNGRVAEPAPPARAAHEVEVRMAGDTEGLRQPLSVTIRSTARTPIRVVSAALQLAPEGSTRGGDTYYSPVDPVTGEFTQPNGAAAVLGAGGQWTWQIVNPRSRPWARSISALWPHESLPLVVPSGRFALTLELRVDGPPAGDVGPPRRYDVRSNALTVRLTGK